MSEHPADRLICPTCRRPPEAWPLQAGSWRCTNPACHRVYPEILPDVPLLVPGPFEPYWAADEMGPLEPLDTLAERVAALEIGGAAWETLFRASMYAVGHYLERPNPFTILCDRLLAAVTSPVGAVVDLGCGVGGLAIEVAHRTGAAVVGLDANPHFLRWAALAAHGAPFPLPVRRSARTFEMVPVRPPVSPAAGHVRFVGADVLHPPLPAEAFDLVLAVNLLDSVPDPWVALGQASALLREGGHLLLAQPDSWTTEVAPASAWIAETGTEWEAALARFGLRTVSSVDGIEWVLQRTPRMRFGYTLHGRLAVRGAWPD